MLDELVVLRENVLPSERTPSVERRIAQLVSALEASASSKPPRRKRKKRRKKRLPRSPRPLLRVRAHRRLRQWLVPGWFFCAALGQGWHARCGTLTGAWFDGSENCGAPAVPVHRRSSTSSSFRRGRSPWSCLFCRSQRFLSCRDDPVVLVVRFHRLFISVYSAMLGSTVDLFLRQFTEIFTFFYLKTRITDPEVDSRLSGVSTSTGLWTLLGDDFRYVSVSPRFDSGYIFGVSLRVLLQEFHIFYVKDVPEVDLVPARFALEIWTLFQQAALMTSLMGFSPHFAAFFALRPHGRECSFFSPR